MIKVRRPQTPSEMHELAVEIDPDHLPAMSRQRREMPHVLSRQYP
jgi:hypothetical protein